MDWWTSCQPPDRVTTSWPFSREPLSSVQWGRFLNGGKYGIFLFVVALSWWAEALDPTTSSPDFAGAVADVEWVLGQLTDVLTTPPTPASATGTDTEVQEIGRAKRKIVLTEKALDLGEEMRKRYRR